MTRKRQLSEEEKLLWQQATRHDKPLRKDVEATEEATEPLLDKLKKSSAKPKRTTTPPTKTAKFLPANTPKEKKLGDYAGIDRNTADKFRRGKSPIDAKLDLHGMSSERAHKALINFIKKQAQLENRRLLVITGKGSGLLRSSLPNWLGLAGVAEFILAFDNAKPQHGGDGAYYILLKRNRAQKNDG